MPSPALCLPLWSLIPFLLMLVSIVVLPMAVPAAKSLETAPGPPDRFFNIHCEHHCRFITATWCPAAVPWISPRRALPVDAAFSPAVGFGRWQLADFVQHL